jgi:hypothetical protein
MAIYLVAGVAQAQQPPPPFNPTITFGRATLLPDTWQLNPDGSVRFVGADTGGTFGSGPSWGLDWDLTVKQDPFINGTITITNFTDSTKDYNFVFMLPVTPAFSPSRMGGRLTATLLDLSGDGSAFLDPLLASPGTPMYRGQIDSNTVLPLFLVNVACFGSGPGCTASGTDSNGMPGVTLPGPGVVSNIGTLLSFSLSAGDRVTFNTNFTVEPVPLPAALPMLLLGLGGFAARRLGSRRRPGAGS